jgi:hypothetical protein
MVYRAFGRPLKPKCKELRQQPRNGDAMSKTIISTNAYSASDPMNIFLTETQLADRQQRSVKTLQNLRVKGGSIPFVKIGRHVRYRLSDVIAWEAAHTLASTSGGPA